MPPHRSKIFSLKRTYQSPPSPLDDSEGATRCHAEFLRARDHVIVCARPSSPKPPRRRPPCARRAHSSTPFWLPPASEGERRLPHASAPRVSRGTDHSQSAERERERVNLTPRRRQPNRSRARLSSESRKRVGLGVQIGHPQTHLYVKKNEFTG